MKPASLGFVEWFRPGEQDRVEQVLTDLRELRVTDLRVGVSWEDWFSAEGEGWYDWLMPRLAREVRVLPCFLDALPFLNALSRLTTPPHDPEAYADWIKLFVARHGKHFDWLELWLDPFLRDPDCVLEPGEDDCFSGMLVRAAESARAAGKQVVLGGIQPRHPKWLKRLCNKGVLSAFDALGLYAFPGSNNPAWRGWPTEIAQVRQTLTSQGVNMPLWITESGFATGQFQERGQWNEFLAVLDAPVERVYWYGLRDHEKSDCAWGEPDPDKRFCFGLRQTDGTPKLLYRVWAEQGLEGVKRRAWIANPGRPVQFKERPVLITGGAGFIATNLAHRLLGMGRSVIILDNLSRAGVERNLDWLRQTHGDRAHFEFADIRDTAALNLAVSRASQVFHLAAQVAVTTSLTQPVHDFEVNARGTLKLLEAIRRQDNPPPLLFTSTNKVYGALEHVGLGLFGRRYEPENPELRANGVSEDARLDFHSPYGCSKGAADQYVLDYARAYDLSAVVFRMSCIYGPHQFGTEDQGWVAHFLIRALENQGITLYGDGMQVRDILYVEDLVDAMLVSMERIDQVSGQAFNVGGGAANSTSLLELMDVIARLHGHMPDYRFGAWRLGDQRYYVSDTRKLQQATGWRPRVGVEEGVGYLYDWLSETRGRKAAPRMTAEVLP